MGISAIINTLNEEANIGDCILSLQGFADEIVVCDMQSDDDTTTIARRLGARIVIIERMEGKYQRMRYLGIEAASGEWVLEIDADERMTERLGQRLREIAQDPTVDIVRHARLYWYFGGWVYHGGFFDTNSPRFFRREVFLNNYHEQTIQAHSDFAALENLPRTCALSPEYYSLHFAYPTIEKYVAKTLGMYARIEAEQYRCAGRSFSMLRLLADPLRTFVRSYVLQRGFRDGIRGFILSVLYAGYRFTTWANLWLAEQMTDWKVNPEPPDCASSFKNRQRG